MFHKTLTNCSHQHFKCHECFLTPPKFLQLWPSVAKLMPRAVPWPSHIYFLDHCRCSQGSKNKGNAEVLCLAFTFLPQVRGWASQTSGKMHSFSRGTPYNLWDLLISSRKQSWCQIISPRAAHLGNSLLKGISATWARPGKPRESVEHQPSKAQNSKHQISGNCPTKSEDHEAKPRRALGRWR